VHNFDNEQAKWDARHVAAESLLTLLLQIVYAVLEISIRADFPE